jgi:UPF0716 family protein affecting phage T7 exclusion
MFILRQIGIWLMLLAVVALVYDGTRMLADDGRVVFTSLGEHWSSIHLPSLNMAQAAVQRHVAPWLWDPVIVTILLLPAWIIAAALGGFFYFLGYRRKKLDVFTN